MISQEMKEGKIKKMTREMENQGRKGKQNEKIEFSRENATEKSFKEDTKFALIPCQETWYPWMKERKAYRIVLLIVKCNITNEKVNPLMGRLHLYILIRLVLFVTKLCISNKQLQGLAIQVTQFHSSKSATQSRQQQA